MDLTKQSKDDLIEHIEEQDHQISKLEKKIEILSEIISDNDKLAMEAHGRLHRALGYIDHVNEGLENTQTSHHTTEFVVERGPKYPENHQGSFDGYGNRR